MGSSKNWSPSSCNHTCTSCDYTVYICGGVNHLKDGRTLTMRCSDCRELVDVRLSTNAENTKHPEQPADDMSWPLPPLCDPHEGMPVPPYPSRCREQYPEIKCPHCSGSRLAYWEPQHGCPRCGSEMKTEGAPRGFFFNQL